MHIHSNGEIHTESGVSIRPNKATQNFTIATADNALQLSPDQLADLRIALGAMDDAGSLAQKLTEEVGIRFNVLEAAALLGLDVRE